MTTQAPYRIMVRATGSWLDAGEAPTLDKASEDGNHLATTWQQSVYSVVDASGTRGI